MNEEHIIIRTEAIFKFNSIKLKLGVDSHNFNITFEPLLRKQPKPTHRGEQIEQRMFHEPNSVRTANKMFPLTQKLKQCCYLCTVHNEGKIAQLSFNTIIQIFW